MNWTGFGSDHSLHEVLSWHLTKQTEENWCPGFDLNQATPAYKSTALPLTHLFHKTFIKTIPLVLQL
jgi:hypothetical protein